VLGEDTLVAGRQIGLREEAEQFVRSIRAEDVVGVEAVDLGVSFEDSLWTLPFDVSPCLPGT
jgi:hypothetical protein